MDFLKNYSTVRQQNFNAMLFKPETSYLEEYQQRPINTPTRKYIPPRPTPVKPQSVITKPIHTLTACDKKIPFLLYHEPKEIVRTNPRIPFDISQKLKRDNVDHELVLRTRPRLYISPAVCMDDVKDPAARKTITTDVYKSSYKRGNDDLAKIVNVKRVEAPIPALPEQANPIYLPAYNPAKVPPEWRLECVEWDRKQARYYSDTHREFWKRESFFKDCKACKQTAQVRTMRQEGTMP